MSGFVCPACGHGAFTAGYCPTCLRAKRYVPLRPVGDSDVVALRSIPDADVIRFAPHGFSGIQEAMAGGFVEGSVTLCYGLAGVGKTRVGLLLGNGLPRPLYISSEQGLPQLKYVARLVGVDKSAMAVAYQPSWLAVERLCSQIKPRVLILDSIHGLTLHSVPDTMRAIVQLARGSGTAVIVFAHVNSEGDYAGVTTLEHDVDALVSLWAMPTAVVWEVVQKYRYGPVGLAGLLYRDMGGFRDGGVYSAAALRAHASRPGSATPAATPHAQGGAGREPGAPHGDAPVEPRTDDRGEKDTLAGSGEGGASSV